MMVAKLVVLLVLCVARTSTLPSGNRTNPPTSPPPQQLHPVIIVPGSLHTVLEARINISDAVQSHPPHPCSNVADAANTNGMWVDFYPNQTWLAPPLADCWIALMALTTTAANLTQQPLAGVEVRPKGAFGAVTSIPSVDPWTAPNASTYVELVSAMVQAGLEPG